jgi:hypothetical protein
MTATCLDTLPDSFLNSGYSSTKRFMSAVSTQVERVSRESNT